MFLALGEGFAGPKRASHAVYAGQGIPAGEALRGIVNEVRPRPDLMPRALDLAGQIIGPAPDRPAPHPRNRQPELAAQARDRTAGHTYARQLLGMTT